jgi:hypothetical protein
MIFSLVRIAFLITQAAGHDSAEIKGVIKQVIADIHLLIVEVSQSEGSSTLGKAAKNVTVEPGTRITLNGKRATLADLRKGQYVKVVLKKNSSQAVSIDVGHETSVTPPKHPTPGLVIPSSGAVTLLALSRI